MSAEEVAELLEDSIQQHHHMVGLLAKRLWKLQTLVPETDWEGQALYEEQQVERTPLMCPHPLSRRSHCLQQ